MYTIRHTLLAGGSAMILALSLAACGGDAQETANSDEPAVEETTVELGTDPEVDPDLINPGWLYDNDTVNGTSDLWYADGDSTKEAVYFTHAANDAGMDVSFVNTDGEEGGVWDLEVEEGHLLTKADASDKRQVDITFQDNFTCYDAVSDTHYVRGTRTQEECDALIAGKSFVDDIKEPDKYMITFGEDGTVTQAMGDSSIEGTWEVQTPNVVVAHFESWDTDFRWDPKADEVTELDDGGPSPLTAYEG